MYSLIIHITVPAVVPPLVVSFINDSPRVHGDGVEADILLSRPVQSLICRLRAQGSEPIEEDCEQYTYSHTIHNYYIGASVDTPM